MTFWVVGGAKYIKLFFEKKNIKVKGCHYFD